VFGLALTVIFVLCNGFFVAAEFSLVKLRATQLDRLARRPDASSRAVVEIFQRLEQYLSATQLGITLASLGLGWVGEPAIAAVLESTAAELGVPVVPALHSVSFALGFAGLTALHIIFGELVPKLVAIASAEKMALVVSRPLRLFHLAMYPALLALNGAASVVLRLLGYPSLRHAEGVLSEDEILGILSQAYARGRLSQPRRQLLERVMRFHETTVRGVMVPRLDVTWIDADTPVEDAIACARASGFTRYPLVEGGQLDKVIGYLNVRDILLPDKPLKVARDALREALVVPETLGLFDLMRTMQHRQIPLGVVLDEYGGTSGIVTLEDVLEEIVGEIRDEHDEEELPKIEIRADGAVVADGLVTLHDLREKGITLSDASADTIGGAVLEKLGRLARPGDTADFEGFSARVENVRRRRVARVLLRRRAPPAAPEA
jgi:CBS domain containing-hemolysin-like protein